MTYPIEYKTIPVQFAFLVSADGTVQIQPAGKLKDTLKFDSEKEAREYISNLTEIL